ncbi:alpha-1-antitrypsin-like [Gastrophryne carolinensis]
MKFLFVLALVIPLIISEDKLIQQDEELQEKAKLSTVSANNEFALKLYKHIASKSAQATLKKNTVVSPLSISTAFSMLALGARSSTHQEIWEALSLNNTQCGETEVHQSFSHLLQTLNKPKSDLQVRIGNAVFVDSSFKLLKSFEDDTQRYYQAEVSRVNFKHPKDVVTQINDYVKSKTEGKIEELVKDIDSDTLLLLLNYVFFKGEWERPFSRDFTRLRKFSVDDVTEVEVLFMDRIGVYPILHDTQLPCTVLELPYKGNASMIIAMAELGKIHEIEQALTIETIQRWRESMAKRRIELYLPKFSAQSSFELEEYLSDFGVKTVFKDSADFSGISQNSKLKVSKAMHKAILDVDEKGTVATATTIIELVPYSRVPSIKVNQPFIAIICDHTTGSILFMATIMNPAEK